MLPLKTTVPRVLRQKFRATLVTTRRKVIHRNYDTSIRVALDQIAVRIEKDLFDYVQIFPDEPVYLSIQSHDGSIRDHLVYDPTKNESQ
jgi:hypothetical protein